MAEQGINPSKKLIKNGSKIIFMEACGVELKDSFHFLQMSLKALPKAYELEEIEKGTFPHLFNTTANANYVGPWPAAHYYTPDSMKPAEREKFLEWYEMVKNEVSARLFLSKIWLLFVHIGWGQNCKL